MVCSSSTVARAGSFHPFFRNSTVVERLAFISHRGQSHRCPNRSSLHPVEAEG
jgi:hypothetical protein